MKNILKICFAIIGAVMGAGFASGQEVMQYFTSFGYIGMFGTIILSILFSITALMMISIGHKMKAMSHMSVIKQLCGRYLGLGYDVVIIFTLFGIGVVMLAGAGPALGEQFQMPNYVGTILMAAVVLITAMAGVKRVVQVLAVLTPIFLFFIVFVNIYSMINGSSADNLEELALNQPSITGHWLTSTINNVSLLTIINAPILFIMGGSEINGKQAVMGGFLGGLGCGLLFLISNIAIYQNMDIVGMLEMPTLGLANEISPILGLIYSITLFGMIYSTAVAMFVSFSARFFTPKTKGFNIFSFISVAIGTALSFYGFSGLVSIVFPAIGYLGYVFLVILLFGYFRIKTTYKTNINDLKKV